ncbi:MAG TPA: hypothetical protein VF007_04440, partial [Stellaceae bacterium]
MAALFGDYDVAKKSGLFDPEYYLATYPDVAQRNIDPLVHYLEEGGREGRNPHRDFDSVFYLKQCKARGETPENPLLHYIRIGAARGLKTRRDAAEATSSDAAQGMGKMPILVAVETLGVAGAPGGGSRLSIGGWALAAAPIVEISAALDGSLLGKARYGLPRPDVADLYPGRDEAGNSGFMLSVELPRLSSGTIEPELTVRTADGEVGWRALRVDVPPQEVAAPAVDPLAPASETAVPSTPPMQLHIDDAVVDERGILRLEGWVVCLVQIESVEAFIEEGRIGEAEFGRVREDVEKARSDYPNSRFSGYVLVSDVNRLGGGRKTVTVRATARTGISREVRVPVVIPESASQRPVSDSAFHHHCDEITLTTDGLVAIKGWAVCASPTAAISVLLDGELIGVAEGGIERPDVGNLLPSLPHARQSGFVVHRRTGKSLQGERLVTLQLLGEAGETHEIALPLLAADAAKGVGGAETAGDAERKLHLDTPNVIGGVMEMPVRGNLEISGWALARTGVERIEIAIDGRPLAVADYGLRRLDIQTAYPDWENSLASGYLCLLPHRLLPKGEHLVSVSMRDRAGKTVAIEFRIEIEALSESSGPWSLRRRMPQAQIDLDRRLLEQRQWNPLFHIVLPVKTDIESLQSARVTIASLAAQVYSDWRLIVVAQAAAKKTGKSSERLRNALTEGFPEIAGRIELWRQLSAQMLTAPTRERASLQPPNFFTVLTPGDELGCDALLEMAVTTALHAEADFLYSDERRLNPATGAVEAFFKPQWSPDLMLSTNYIGRLWWARADLLRAVAEPTEALLAHGEYDLLLRCTEAAKAIRQVPAVLCERAGHDPNPRDRAALERAV